MSSAMTTLTVTITLFIVLAVLLPYAYDTFNESGELNNFESVIIEIQTGDFNLLTIPVWFLAVVSSIFIYTFGATFWVNVFLLVPLRIIMMISAYYVLLPTK